MIRVEIVANRSVEENLLEAFREEGVGKYYTKYPNVLGVGSSGPRMGDAIWPEENFALVIWCEEAEAQGLEKAVAAVKKQFPDEGIKIFKPAVQIPVSVPAITYATVDTDSVIQSAEMENVSEPTVLLPLPHRSHQSYGPESENY